MQGYRIKYVDLLGNEHWLELTGDIVTIGMCTRIDDIVTDGLKDCGTVEGRITDMSIMRAESQGWVELPVEDEEE